MAPERRAESLCRVRRHKTHSRPNRQEDPMGKGASTEQVVRDIHRRTRRRFSAEEKVRIVLDGLRGEQSVAELCRRAGLAPNLDDRWRKEFLEAGKKRLRGDTTREATAPEGKGRRDGNTRLKRGRAQTGLENRLLKKRLTGSDGEGETGG